MTSHRMSIATEYLNAHFFYVLLSVYMLRVLKALFMQIFVISVERVISLVYSVPLCINHIKIGSTCLSLLPEAMSRNLRPRRFKSNAVA